MTLSNLTYVTRMLPKAMWEKLRRYGVKFERRMGDETRSPAWQALLTLKEKIITFEKFSKL